MNFLDYITFERVLWTIGILVGLVIIYFAYQLIFYRWEYSKPITSNGVVVGMEYEPPRTRVHTTTSTVNGSTTTSTYTTTDPEEHHVFIEVDGERLEFDHQRLYQAVRVDDDVQVTYQKVRKYHINTPHEKIPCGYRVLFITTVKGRNVEVNEPKRATY